MATEAQRLDALFPASSPGSLFVSHIPGPTSESGKCLIKLLKDNHIKHHIFFNDKGFHNHAAHHLLAIYHLGASAPLLEAAYKTHTSYLLPSVKPPTKIDANNFHEHLGDGSYFQAYLEFFSEVVVRKGSAAVLEEFIFSPKYNIEEPVDGALPMRMLNRFHAAVLHPLIHLGYGAEFGLPGIVVEGLAQAAVHRAEAPVLVPDSLFHRSNGLASSLASLSLTGNSVSPGRGPHVLAILAQVAKDARFAAETFKVNTEGDDIALTTIKFYDATLEHHDKTLADYAQKWNIDGSDAADVQRKIEEITWMTVLIFGVGGWGKRYRSKTENIDADFFLAHLVTSVLFLPALVKSLSPTSTVSLLRTYLAFALTWYVGRGRPALPIKEFFAAVPTDLSGPSPRVTRAADALSSDSTPNPWFPIVQSALVHPDEHLCKVQRSLAHFATVYGDRPAGTFAGLTKDGLDGAETLDGTLFVRVAGLVAGRLGWMWDGEQRKSWDYSLPTA